MSNYSVTTNFGAKDALTSGDPNKLVLGSQLTTEFNAIATAISTKLDAGSGFANPTASVGLAAVNGAATTAMRSDAAPALDVSITPTWTGIHTFSARPVFNAGATVNGTLVASGAISGSNLSSAGGANPSASAGLAAVNGSAITYMRSDGAPAISQAIVPSWSGLHTFTGGAKIAGDAASNLSDLTLQNTGASGHSWRIGDGVAVSNGIFAFYDATSTAVRMQINSTGNVTINAPSAGPGLTVNGVAATPTQVLALGGTTTAYAYQQISNTSGNLLIGVDNSAGGGLISGTSSYSGVLSTGNSTPLWLGTNSAARLGISTTGAVTINAPTSGVALTATGASNANVAAITTSGTGAGLVINSFIQDRQVKLKGPSNETRISTTTMTDDNTLTMSLVAGTYLIRSVLKFSATTTAGMGIKFTLLYSGTSTLTGFSCLGSVALNPVNLGDLSFGSPAAIANLSTTGAFDMVDIVGRLVATTSGTLSVQYAQNSSTASNLTVFNGSYLEAIRVA